MRVTAAHSPGVEVSILRVELAVEVWTEAWLRGHRTVCTHTHRVYKANKRMRQRPSRATSTQQLSSFIFLTTSHYDKPLMTPTRRTIEPKYSITILNVRVLTFHVCQFVAQDVSQVLSADKKTLSVFCGLSHVPLRAVLVCMCVL